MKLLVISKLDRFARAASTITKYVQAGKALGHEVVVFGEQSAEFPSVPFSLDVTGFDRVVFVVYETKDFPDLPYLARLLDGVPRERRAIIDCSGRYNETVRVEHDFNHLEKLDSHQGWEWVEGFQAVSDKILQPTLTNVTLYTSFGNILYDGDFIRTGIYSMKSGRGLVEVRFASTDSFDLNAQTTSGTVENRAEALLKPDSHGIRHSAAKYAKGLFGSVGNGLAKVELSSFSGTIRILRRD